MLNYSFFHLFLNATFSFLQMVESIFYASLRFSTNFSHDTSLWFVIIVGWPSLANRRYIHWCIFIYKVILGLLPPYLCTLQAKGNALTCCRKNGNWLTYIPYMASKPSWKITSMICNCFLWSVILQCILILFLHCYSLLNCTSPWPGLP